MGHEVKTMADGGEGSRRDEGEEVRRGGKRRRGGTVSVSALKVETGCVFFPHW